MSKIEVHIATLAQRDKSLSDTILSLYNQADKIFVYYHGEGIPPAYLTDPKIEVYHELEHGNRGDLDKFFMVSDTEEDKYLFFCDDDLIYPEDYCQTTIEKFKFCLEDNNLRPSELAVSYHGAIPFKLPIGHYYRDRYTFPCLSSLETPQRVSIGGTGVMMVHSSFDLKGLLKKDMNPFMADIYFGVYAGKNNKTIICLDHNEGWLKHSEFVKEEETIWGIMKNNPFAQTQLINENPDVFNTLKKTENPLVSIVMVNSRMKSNPNWVSEALQSIREQSYPNIEVIMIENYDKMMTIGKCYNDGAKKAQGKWVLYCADDDYIAPDYVTCLVALAEESLLHNNDIIGCTSYLTMFQELPDGSHREEPRELIPTGMYLKRFLLEHPFREYLTRYVDTELFGRIKELKLRYAIATWNYGYFYRSHAKQVSGHKAMVGSHGSAPNTDEDKLREELSKQVPDFKVTNVGLDQYEIEVK